MTQQITEITSPVIQSMYINKFELWLATPDKYLAWSKREGVNSMNIYARSYLKTASLRKKLASFIILARKYGVREFFIDYRGIDEIPYWKLYFKEYPTAAYKINPITEIEPYRDGTVSAYNKFYAAIKEENKFCIDFDLISGCYMGQPKTQECWNEIVKYCNRVYLSKYISMATYNANKSFNFVAERVSRLSLAAKINNKINFPFVYITSLEKISWGAKNDFQGDLYINNSFYGDTYNKDVADYNSKTTNEAKMYTDLIGSCMFVSEYCLKARKI